MKDGSSQEQTGHQVVYPDGSRSVVFGTLAEAWAAKGIGEIVSGVAFEGKEREARSEERESPAPVVDPARVEEARERSAGLPFEMDAEEEATEDTEVFEEPDAEDDFEEEPEEEEPEAEEPVEEEPVPRLPKARRGRSNGAHQKKPAGGGWVVVLEWNLCVFVPADPGVFMEATGTLGFYRKDGSGPGFFIAEFEEWRAVIDAATARRNGLLKSEPVAREVVP